VFQVVAQEVLVPGVLVEEEVAYIVQEGRLRRDRLT